MFSVKNICVVKNNLFYITLLGSISSVKGIFQIYEHCDNCIYTLNTTNLIESFQYLFRKHYCVEIIEDKSYMSAQLVKIIHNLPYVPTYILGVINSNINCRDRIYISTNLKVFIRLLKTYPIVKRKFLSIIINNNITNLFQQIVEEGTSEYLNNSYGVIVDLKASNVFYKYIPLHKTFKVLMVSDIKRNQEGINYGNFRRRKLKVGTFNCTINSVIGPLYQNGTPSWFEGIEMKFFDEITTKLNFTYEVVLPNFTLGTNRYGALLEMVSDKKIDVAFCGIWETSYNILSPVDITSPINDVCLTLLVPRPLPFGQNGRGLFSSFTREVWAIVFLSLLMVTVFMQTIAIVIKYAEIKYDIRKFIKFQNSLLTLWGILFTNAPKSLSKLGPLRHTLVWWGVFSLLFNTFFSSSLITRLTRTLYEKPPETIQELVESDYHWFLNYNPTFRAHYNLDNQWAQKWVDHFWLVNLEAQCGLIKEAKWKFAFPASKHMDGVVLQQSLDCPHILQKYQLMPECFSRHRTAFLLQLNSPYTEVFSDYITRYQESGVFIKEYRDTFHKKILKENYIYEVGISSQKQINKRVKLKLSNTSAIFYILLLGITLSTLMFLCELFWYNKSNWQNYFKFLKSHKIIN